MMSAKLALFFCYRSDLHLQRPSLPSPYYPNCGSAFSQCIRSQPSSRKWRQQGQIRPREGEWSFRIQVWHFKELPQGEFDPVRISDSLVDETAYSKLINPSLGGFTGASIGFKKTTLPSSSTSPFTIDDIFHHYRSRFTGNATRVVLRSKSGRKRLGKRMTY